MINRLVSLHLLLALAAAFPLLSADEAQPSPPAGVDAASGISFYVIPVMEQIAPPTLYAIRNGVKSAIEGNFDYVVLDMKTPGGRLDTTLQIMEVLDRFPGKTITYVNDEATSAGAIIAAVTSEIYFSPRATMGSAEVVSGDGKDIDASMKRKITSYLNAKLDAYTDEYPFRSEVIRAMMDPTFEFSIGEQVISPRDELLNLNARAAHLEYGDPPRPILGSGIVEDLDSLLASLALGREMVVERFDSTWSLRLAQYIVMLSPLLLAVAMISIYVEFQTPGFGVFGAIGVVCFLIAIFGHNVAGLSGHEPLLLFLLGILLLALEIIFIPGTLYFAIPGLLLMIASLLWSMTDIWPTNTPDFVWEWSMLERPFQNLALGALLGFVIIVAIARFLPKSLVWNRLVLQDVIGGAPDADAPAGSEGAADAIGLGTEGVAVTDLMPSGEIEISGRRFEARLAYGSAESGARVRIVGRASFSYIVEEVRT